MGRLLGDSESVILINLGNLANTYQLLGRTEQAIRMRRDVYSGSLKLRGEEHGDTILAAYNYVVSLNELKRFEETKSVLRKPIPLARRVLGESNELTIKMRWNYASALYKDDCATLDDLREAVTTHEDLVQTARRVLGSAHPAAGAIGNSLRNAQEALRARETPPPGSS